MKQLVCDFCDSIKLGAKVGYKEFKRVFSDARTIRKYAKEHSHTFKAQSVMEHQDPKVKKVREMAQMNYKEDTK
jgi:hypothetical protein